MHLSCKVMELTLLSRFFWVNTGHNKHIKYDGRVQHNRLPYSVRQGRDVRVFASVASDRCDSFLHLPIARGS